jgi:hypothetical protein
VGLWKTLNGSGVRTFSDLLSWEVAHSIKDAILHMIIGDDARGNLKQAFFDTFEEITQLMS